MEMDNREQNRYALVREMLETADLVSTFDEQRVERFSFQSKRLLLTGEGSSRIFPAKRLIAEALRQGGEIVPITEGATQALEYYLSDYHVFVASNSGKTAEGVRLVRALRARGNPQSRLTAVAASGEAPIPQEADDDFILTCGKEEAVAATKSVVEQALFYDILYRKATGGGRIDWATLGGQMRKALTLSIPKELVKAGVRADTIYFAGRNDGVAEELTLKTNEITRKKSDFLEGTYAVHGIEEVMKEGELLVLIDPFPETEEKFESVLSKGAGVEIIAIADRETRFPTIQIPESREHAPYLQLLAGWNLLVEIGMEAGIDLDKPERARKVGNEYTG